MTGELFQLRHFHRRDRVADVQCHDATHGLLCRARVTAVAVDVVERLFFLRIHDETTCIRVGRAVIERF